MFLQADGFYEDCSQALFLIDRSGRILAGNALTALSLGISLEQLLKSNVKELVKNGLYKYSYALDAIRLKKTVSGIISTNTGVCFTSVSTPLIDSNGEVYLVITTSSPKQSLEVLKINRSKSTEKYQLVKSVDPYEDVPSQSLVVAESIAMKRILKVCDQVARSECKVLLFGESGTGKEVLTKYIHDKSMRAKQPFISVNCAAIPESLFESEFFGHEKGSFTGASEQKKGLLELADNGTLFLDEISEMPLDLQAKLLRVLENPEIRRIGGTKSFQVNFRLICATNRDLSKMVEKGTFRKDLYYRINVIPVHIPPLRKRRLDILGLSRKFLFDFNRKYDKNTQLNSIHLKQLLNHNWPGNIRELKNHIERMVIIDEGYEVIEGKARSDDFLIDFDYLDFLNKDNWPTLNEFLREVEFQYIQKVLSFCNGKKNLAADVLGIYRTVLYKKLKDNELTDNIS
ncbi:AAA family ATPase [Bacillus sp. B15-48]|nr:AAA family ATPase [Bacillus sp. B15-48]